MNLPNKISTFRICLIPLVVFFYLATFIPYGKLIAAIIFTIAVLSDFFDGRIARKRNLVTNLGKFLDPIADKVLVMAGFLLIVASPVTANVAADGAVATAIVYPSYVGIVAVAIILARELIVSAFRQIAATKNVVLAADMYGKVKATFQFLTLIYYFLYAFIIEEFYVGTSEAWVTANAWLSLVGYVLLAVTVILTIVSGVKYITGNKEVLKEE